jgi:hypothetical protein
MVHLEKPSSDDDDDDSFRLRVQYLEDADPFRLNSFAQVGPMIRQTLNGE